MVEVEGLYTVKFKCPNCLTIFSKDILKGYSAAGNAGNCPKCECSEDSVVRSTGQKLGRFEIVPETEEFEVTTKGTKFEILMEEDGIKLKIV